MSALKLEMVAWLGGVRAKEGSSEGSKRRRRWRRPANPLESYPILFYLGRFGRTFSVKREICFSCSNELNLIAKMRTPAS